MTNSSSNHSAAGPGLAAIPDYEIACQALLLVAVLLACLLGNGLVCYCVLTIRLLQQPTNYFILSLACADFLFALLCLPFRLLDILWGYTWRLGLAACRFWVWSDLLFCSASIANLAAISVDRYCKIASPLTYDARMTPCRVAATLAILWTYSLALASLILVTWSDDPAAKARGIIVQNRVCYCESKIFLTAICVIGFFVPFTIMLFMYCFVFKVAVGQARRLSQQCGSFQKPARGRKGNIFLEVKATKTLVILLSAFCICWSPYFVLSLVSLHSPQAFAAMPLWFVRLLKIVFVNLLPNFNAALDPLIYTTHNVQFRKAVWKLLCGPSRRRRFDSAGVSRSFTESEEMTGMSRRSSLNRSIAEHATASAPASGETAT